MDRILLRKLSKKISWENDWIIPAFMIKFKNTTGINPVDTGRKLNVHKTFRRRPGRLLNVLFTFKLRPVSTGKGLIEIWAEQTINKVPKTIVGATQFAASSSLITKRCVSMYWPNFWKKYFVNAKPKLYKICQEKNSLNFSSLILCRTKYYNTLLLQNKKL